MFSYENNRDRANKLHARKVFEYIITYGEMFLKLLQWNKHIEIKGSFSHEHSYVMQKIACMSYKIIKKYSETLKVTSMKIPGNTYFVVL